MPDESIYKPLYEHTVLCFEVEERHASRLQVRFNFLLTVILAALGLGFFSATSELLPNAATELASAGGTAAALLIVGGLCLLLAMAHLFGILPGSPEGVEKAAATGAPQRGDEPAGPATFRLHLDSTHLDQIPGEIDDHYLLIFAETQRAAVAFHRENRTRAARLDLAQGLMMVGLVFLVLAFCVLAVMIFLA